MAWETIVFEASDGVGTLTLNRPDRLNSFNERMHEEVAAVLGTVESDAAIRALLITGAGRGFCAGQDLNLRDAGATGDFDAGAALERYYNPLIRRLRALEKPIVAAVNGPAAGAGANIAFACDIVVAAEEAVFIQSFGKIGLIPDSGGTFILPRIVGLQRAAALTMLGEKLPASRAKEWGLVYDVVPHTVLASTSFEIAKRLACLPTRGFGLTKRGFNAAFSNDLDTQLALEEELQGEAGRTLDYTEGVQAFIEKRPPRFKGC
jgi:2-(1,2-epoxy-1,2-dihydrophenyl)acetyl-CoA isomerase